MRCDGTVYILELLKKKKKAFEIQEFISNIRLTTKTDDDLFLIAIFSRGFSRHHSLQQVAPFLPHSPKAPEGLGANHASASLLFNINVTCTIVQLCEIWQRCLQGLEKKNVAPLSVLRPVCLCSRSMQRFEGDHLTSAAAVFTSLTSPCLCRALNS